ncbi:MAG: glycosyltransferase family 9 protein [Chloroflexi bacterium]|nr:glycosyltransferase family 9 protein [Chloroflexota bacterium]
MRILVIKLSDRGDLLTATPALRALGQTYAQAHIAALVPPHSAEVLEGLPYVHRLLTFQKELYDRWWDALNPNSLLLAMGILRKIRREEFDRLVILHHFSTIWGAAKFAFLALSSGAKERVGLDNGRGWFLTKRAKDLGFGRFHEVEYWLQVASTLGAHTENRRLEIFIPPEDEARATEWMSSIEGKIIVALHPGGGQNGPSRRWLPQGFAEIGRTLAEKYKARILLVGGAQEQGLAQQVADLMDGEALNWAGRTSFKELGAILKHCHLFVGNDSGVMHLATAVGVPVVAVFGPSNPRAWGPWADEGDGKRRAHVVRPDLPCSPCLYVNKTVGNRRGCSHMACLANITPDMVLEAAEMLLDRRMSHEGTGIYSGSGGQ